MLDFINIENVREGLMKLVGINEMFLHGEIELEPCRDMLYYPVSAQDRFMGYLVESVKSQLKMYTYFLEADYKEDYLDWIIIDGREGYERVMLDIHRIENYPDWLFQNFQKVL